MVSGTEGPEFEGLCENMAVVDRRDPWDLDFDAVDSNGDRRFCHGRSPVGVFKARSCDPGITASFSPREAGFDR